MAEFSDVVKHWARFCAAMQKKIEADGKYYTCDGCPLENNRMCTDTADAFTVDAMREVEDTVMAWAKDNPEPVYPSWWEFVKWHKSDGRIEETASDIVAWMVATPIPAHIAQVMGLEPKGE